MDLRLAFLIFLLLLPTAAFAKESCLKCHPVHYPEGGSCTSCHRGDPRSARPEIAHHEIVAGRFAHFGAPRSPVVERGVKAIEKGGCRRCHVVAGKGNRLAADLDRLLPSARPDEVLQAIRRPVLFMPDFALREKDGVEVVNALFAASARAPRKGGDVPQVVHFQSGERKENPFEKHCGGCHRLLSGRWGGVGRGDIGPNLSGLFSEHYPSFFRQGERWTPQRLKKWLENPRAVRPQARMRPVSITGAQEDRLLLDVLGHPSGLGESVGSQREEEGGS